MDLNRSQVDPLTYMDKIMDPLIVRQGVVQKAGALSTLAAEKSQSEVDEESLRDTEEIAYEREK